MKNIYILFIISNLLVIDSFGQETYIKNRWNFKAGYSLYKSSFYRNNLAVPVRNYRLEANYGILNYFETGVYAGYSKFELFKIDFADSTVIRKECATPFYGISCNFHLFPFLIKEDDFRFDLYFTGKLGGEYFTSPAGFKPHGNVSEYGLGAGMSFYIFRHSGIFAEYSYGKYYFRDNHKFRYGLTLKF